MTKRKHVLQLAVCLGMVLVLFAGILQTDPAKAVTTTCVTYSGTNVNAQNYTTWNDTIKSYLYYCSDGTLMRVQYGSSIGGVLVEYYDTSYNLKKSQIIPMELPVFGGFYATGGYYYLLTGQNNTGESNNTEVFRVTKYDTGWKRLGAASLYGANTYIPFDAGSARFAAAGKYLLIRTSHEMYASSDGYHHQANVTLQVDTSTMKVTDSFTSVANIGVGYVSHSFNQFIQIEGNKIVAVDHGDAYPRSIVLTKYSKDVTGGTFQGSVTASHLITFAGATGANYTGASVGGFEISDTAYLVAGSQDIDASGSYTSGRNIFVAAQNKSTGTVTVNKITDYTSGSGQTSTPHLVKLTSSSYMLLWSRGSTVYYTKLDGNGKKTGDIYQTAGDLSDCVPILVNGKVIWYTWNNGTITFYEIPTSNLAGAKRTIIQNGHQYQFGTTVSADGTVSRTCKQCGAKDTVTVPTSFSVWWKDTSATDGYYWSGYSSSYIEGTQQFPVNTSLLCWIQPGDAECNEMVVESSNPDVIAIGSQNNDKLLTMKKAGISLIKIYPKYNPGLYKTYLMRVGENGSVNISGCTAALSPAKCTYTGSALTPDVTVKSGQTTLTKNTDYTVTYTNNTNVGTATVTITGKGLFTGTLKKTFAIEGIPIPDTGVKLGTTSYTYDGTARKPAVTVTVNGKTLKNGTDYTLTYTNNTNAGTATVKVAGKGNYSGTISKTFKINAVNISSAAVTLGTTSYTYDGSVKKPAVTVKVGTKVLTSGTDYTVTYANNTNAGTATVTVTGKGNYTGTATSKPTFKINAASLTDAAVTLGTTSYTYDGTAKKPAVTVKLGTKTLVSGTDYTVAYKNNTNAGTATVTVTGKGNYAGSKAATFKINAVSITAATVTLGTTSYTYDGTARKPAVTVKLGTKILKNGTDYTVTYANNTNAGTATVTITGKGNYTGTAKAKPTFRIQAADITNAAVTLGTTSYTYDGTAKKPDVTVKVGTKTLKSGTDYTVTYANNTNAGTATVTVTGKGNYNGTATSKPTFKINAASLTNAAVTLGTTSYTYDGTAKKPAVTVKLGTRTLKNGTDYTVTYANNTNAGTATVTIKGKGNYSETAKAKPTFQITPVSITGAAVTLGTTSYTYDGTAKKPAATVKIGTKTLKSGTDYTVTYANNTNAGTATVTIKGKGNYSGTAKTKPTFQITPVSITGATVTLGTTSYTYDGVAKKPAVTVKVGTKTLNSGTDYTVTYANNTNVGTATVTIKGKGNYSGTAKTKPTFQITAVNLKEATVALGTTSYTYDGTAKKPAVTVKVGTKTLISGTDYTVTYAKNTNPGDATVTVKGKGNYTGSKSVAFQILPPVVQNIKTKSENKAITISWDAAPGATGYMIYRRENGSWVRIGKTETCSYKDSGLAAGSTYQYAVRTYTTTKSGDYLSATYPTVNGMPQLDKVTGIGAETSAYTVKLTWSKVSNAQGYYVYKYNTAKHGWDKIASTGSLLLYDRNLAAGTSYWYAVRAYKVLDGVTYLSPSYDTFKTSTVPAAVSFSLTAGSRQATVKWNKVNGATSYIVYYKTSAGGSWQKLTSTTGTSYTKTGLTSGKTYYFTVRAYRSIYGVTHAAEYTSKSITIK